MADQFKQGQVTANGIDFHTLAMGAGPLALCLHGFPDTARSFRHQLPALAGAGFRAVAPFMRGYAPTGAAPDGRYDLGTLAQDAIALIDALGGGADTILIGHDWGAAAAHFAAAAAPAKIRKLITAAVPYGPGIFQAFVTNYAQQRRSWYMFFFQQPLAEAAIRHDDFAFLDHLWRDWSPGWRWAPEDMAALKECFRAPGTVEAALAYYRQTIGGTLNAPAQPAGAAPVTAPIMVPTLMLHGRDDGCIGTELLAGQDAYFPRGVRVEVVPGAGHFVHQEKPDAVNRLILDFIKS